MAVSFLLFVRLSFCRQPDTIWRAFQQTAAATNVSEKQLLLLLPSYNEIFVYYANAKTCAVFILLLVGLRPESDSLKNKYEIAKNKRSDRVGGRDDDRHRRRRSLPATSRNIQIIPGRNIIFWPREIIIFFAVSGNDAA